MILGGIVCGYYGTDGGGINQQALNKIINDLRTELRNERAGVSLIADTQQLVTNINATRTDAQVLDDISFSGVPLFAGDMDDYDHFILEISELNSDATTADSTSVQFTYTAWNALKGVPRPQGNNYQSAHTDDGRALRWAWQNNPPAEVSVNLPNNARQRDKNLMQAIENLSDNIRAASRVLFVGKSSESNARMLVAVTGIKNNFRCRVYGYKGATS